MVTVLFTGGVRVGAVSTGPPPSTLTAEEAIAGLQTAVAAQAGLIKEVEGDGEKGNAAMR